MHVQSNLLYSFRKLSPPVKWKKFGIDFFCDLEQPFDLQSSCMGFSHVAAVIVALPWVQCMTFLPVIWDFPLMAVLLMAAGQNDVKGLFFIAK